MEGDPEGPKAGLNVVLLGKTGSGKSATGNTILGRKAFTSMKCPSSVTQDVAVESGTVCGLPVTVYDTPGFCDTEKNEQEIQQIYQSVFQKCGSGPCVFLLVIKADRFTKEERETVEKIEKLLGENRLQNTWILFTRGDELEEENMTIDDLIKQTEPLKKQIQKYERRYLVFNNKKKRVEQVKMLLKEFYKLYKDLENIGEGTISEEGMLHLTTIDTTVMHKRDNSNLGKVEEVPQQINKEKKTITEIMSRLDHFGKYQTPLKIKDFLQVSAHSPECHKPSAEKNLIEMFFQRLLMMDYRSRYISIKEISIENPKKNKDFDMEWENAFENSFKKSFLSDKGKSEVDHIHPMDVQMAVFHCADSFLKQLMVTKLSQCQYALPLLVPDPLTQHIEFPLWTFRQINKSWKTFDDTGKIISKVQSVCKAETPMVCFFRFGSVSSSKSHLMNRLINEKHNTFFHRNCPGSSRTRVLMDGVVEIAWYCPSGKNTDTFTDCVAFCNLHGDAGDHEKQLQILTEMSSVNVVILPQLDRNDKSATQIQNFYKTRKPLICLFTRDKSAVIQTKKGKYKIGLKDRNQSDVSEELRSAINDCLSISSSESSSIFSLEDVSKHSDIRVDEDDEDCRRGKEAAQQMMRLLENKDLTKIKESFLPCQGKLWHQWCQKNKELHRPQGNELQSEICRKHTEIKKIRELQHESDISEFIKRFIEQMNADSAIKMFFLKWLVILLDEYTSADLSALYQTYNKMWLTVLKKKDSNEKTEHLNVEKTELEKISETIICLGNLLDEHISTELSALHHKYDDKWSTVLQLKEKNKSEQLKTEQREQLKTDQTELERISEELQAANFGLEHVLREIGQIYESCSSVKKNKEGLQFHFSSLPSLAAEMMISGFPLELMDGDAAHVPLIWISAVLGELIKKLGDQRVFVLSVLGIQSSGKSTMLNAMFGLQFAVSAGRCTRGAFMQLVRVSEEMKAQLKFDYILVVDTEGLRALELAGRSTRLHDNELATFVVGLGHLTLINIFGENPSEMQDTLQIVVQAFLRMKKVRLNPSCMFVHQNVSDVTAGEKNMEGRRRLLEKLDEMTKLAAKEEVCNAESFSDVIAFDVENDVKYFAQLWEGSPPMAPPNPNYCENVQDLKKTIISHASKSDIMMLKHLKDRIKDLWKALLNERFVFSFRNSLEIQHTGNWRQNTASGPGVSAVPCWKLKTNYTTK